MKIERDDGLGAEAKCDDKKLINRLRRVEGQLRGLERLIESGGECRQVLTQLTAAKAALDQIGIAIVGGKIKECMESENGEEEIDQLLKKFLKGVVV